MTLLRKSEHSHSKKFKSTALGEGQQRLLTKIVGDTGHVLLGVEETSRFEEHKKIKNSSSSKKISKKIILQEEEEEASILMSDRFVKLVELARLSRKFVGAHVSMAGGVKNAVSNSVRIGGQSFALFLKSQRRWETPPLEEYQVAAFKEAISRYNYDCSKILPHGSYLVNLGSPNEEMLEKGRQVFFDDVKRCETLNITLYNFHPGSTTGNNLREESVKRIAESMNLAHAMSKHVICVIENMSGQGSTLGGDFRELAAIIDHVHDKTRVGVCLDTCHMFAYGYDIRTAEKFDKILKEFDSIVGLNYLRAMHINDSKAELGSKKDRHENIGKGQIGMEAFKFIMNDRRFNDMPLILETPAEDGNETSVYQREIDLLYSLVDSATLS